MSTIQPNDAFIINREGKDYKATVDQFAKDINIHVECGGGGTVHWDDIEGKPCLPECDGCFDLPLVGISYSAARDNFYIYLVEATPALLKELEPYSADSYPDKHWLDVPVTWVNESGEKVTRPAAINPATYSAPNRLGITFDDNDFDYIGEQPYTSPSDYVPLRIGECGSGGGGTVHWDDIEGKPCLVECLDCTATVLYRVAGDSARVETSQDNYNPTLSASVIEYNEAFIDKTGAAVKINKPEGSPDDVIKGWMHSRGEDYNNIALQFESGTVYADGAEIELVDCGTGADPFDGYTKAESDARYISTDVASLPPL